MFMKSVFRPSFYLNSKLLKSPRKLFSTTPQWKELNTEYFLNPTNLQKICENIAIRKGVGNIELVHSLKHKLDGMEVTDTQYEATKTQLDSELLKLPNKTHPDVIYYGSEPRVIRTAGTKREFASQPKEFHEIVKRLKLVRTDQLGHLAGNKSYYLLGELAELEHALIRYVVSNLLRHDFKLVSVPDILPRDVIEACGMNTRGTRTQVYALDEHLHGPDLCLSGTSEMSLAALLANKTVPDLPLKLAAVSRCYRAETSNLLEERGIYRVHEFTKVEMFAVTAPDASTEMLEHIRTLQETFFESLGLHYKVLDMPPVELGAQAYRKYDIEAWLSGRGIYGEISSCSDCLDYQARRLGIKCRDGFVHTLNGTACAVPRMLIALVEGGQNSNGTVSVPEVLHKYMGGKGAIGKQKRVPELKLIKNKK